MADMFAIKGCRIRFSLTTEACKESFSECANITFY